MAKKRISKPNFASDLTVQDAFDQFQRQNVIKNLSQDTIEFYSSKARRFFMFLGDANQPVSNITNKTVEDYIIWTKERNVKDTTVNTNLRMVRTFLYWCMEQHYIEHFNIKMIKADEPVKEPYTTEELDRLLKAPNKKTCSFSEYRNWVIINFFLGTGCRASTLIKLQIEDLNLTDGTVRYRHMKARKQQIVPLAKTLICILKEYLTYRNGKPNEVLFPSEFGTMMTIDSLESAIRSYNHSRGVSKTSLHLFRHTYAKLYIQAGGDPFRLQKLLGHSDITMTKKYVALYADDLKTNYDTLNPLEQMTHNIHQNKKIKMKK